MNITPIFQRNASGIITKRKSIYEELLKTPFQRNFRVENTFSNEMVIESSGNIELTTTTDSDFIKYGDKSLKITVNPDDGTSFFEIEFANPLNLLDRAIGIPLFVPSDSMEGEQNAKFANLPFYLYAENGRRISRWIPAHRGDRRYEGWNYILGDHYFYSYDGTKSDLSNVNKIRFNIYHKEHITEPFDIYLNGIVSWDDVRIPTIRIEFDDNYPSVYENAFPAMSKRGIKGCTHVVTNRIGKEQGNHPYQLRKMHDVGWDVCSHSYSHPTFAEISNEEIEHELSQSQMDLLNIGLRRGPQVFVAPQGSMVPYEREYARQIYRVYRGTGYFSGETHTSIDPYDLKCRGLGGASLQTAIDIIDSVVEKGGFESLMWHGEIGEPWGSNPGWEVSEFEDLLDYVIEKNVNVITYSDQIPYSSF